MTQPPKRNHRGEKLSSAIDARRTSRDDTQRWQSIRPTEGTDKEILTEDVITWKEAFREYSGYKNPPGELTKLSTKLQTRMGDWLRGEISPHDTDNYFSSLHEMTSFLQNIQRSLRESLDPVYTEELEKFEYQVRLAQAGLALISSLDRSQQIQLTEDTVSFLEQSASKLVRNIEAKTGMKSVVKSDAAELVRGRLRGGVQKEANVDVFLNDFHFFVASVLSYAWVTDQALTRADSSVSQERLEQAWAKISSLAQFLENARAKLEESGWQNAKISEEKLFSRIVGEKRSVAKELWTRLLN